MSEPDRKKPQAISKPGVALGNTILLGSVQAITALIGLAKTKAAAVVLGPIGVGLHGTYTNLLDFAATLTGLGMSSSGVRQVAEAAANGDERYSYEVAISLVRVLTFLGITGVEFFV